METDPAALAQLIVDIAKNNPLPSVLIGLLLLFLVRRNPKNMAKLTVALLICGYAVHLVSGLSEEAAKQKGSGYDRTADLIEKNDR